MSRLTVVLNIITVCLFLTSSLIGSTYFDDSFWLKGQKLNPDMEVISGPANLSYIPCSVQLLTPPLRAKRKCTPSQPLQDSTTNIYEPDSNYATVFGVSEVELSSATTISDPRVSDLPVSDISVAYYTSVVLHSNLETTLPFNAHLGNIRPITITDKTAFAEAAKDTSEQLINAWETYLYCQQANQNTEQAQVIISEQTIKQKQPRLWTN